jgi:hypothetical protein
MLIQSWNWHPVQTRPCKYSLCLQDGSVFADFDIDKNNCLYLVRISFDGYGCCNLGSSANIGKIDKQGSQLIIEAIKSGHLETPEVIRILKKYFLESKASLWEDALIKHELI